MTEPDVQRHRSYSWHDPLETARLGRELSGLEHLLAMGRGEIPLPPIMATLGMEGAPPQAEEGRVTFFLNPQEYHMNPIGSVHGGVYATLLDSAMGCAVQTRLPAGVGYTTLELSVRFVRPLQLGKPVRCEGVSVSAGRTVATAEGRIVDEDGRLYATGATTCLILRP